MVIRLKNKLCKSVLSKVVNVTSQFISLNPVEQNLLLKWPAIKFLINKSLRNNELIRDIIFNKEDFKKVSIELKDESVIELKVENISIKNQYGFLKLKIKLLGSFDITNICIIKQFGLSCMGILTGKGAFDTKVKEDDSIEYCQKEQVVTLPINKEFSSKGILSKIPAGSEASASFINDGLLIDYPEGTNLTSVFKMVA
jgi:hypothetical protein